MADRDCGECGGGKQLLQPFDAGQVEVIGRLVQQHHFGIADQRFNNGQPLAPAAGERGGLRGEIGKTCAPSQLAQPAFALGFVHVGGA